VMPRNLVRIGIANARSVASNSGNDGDGAEVAADPVTSARAARR
jgi:hypothetical protein